MQLQFQKYLIKKPILFFYNYVHDYVLWSIKICVYLQIIQFVRIFSGIQHYRFVENFQGILYCTTDYECIKLFILLYMNTLKTERII